MPPAGAPACRPRPTGSHRHAFGPEHVHARRTGLELPVGVEPVRVRQALVASQARQGVGDRPAIDGARAERREQHPAPRPTPRGRTRREVSRTVDWKSWMKRRASGRVDEPRSTHAHVTIVPSPAPAVVDRYASVFIADEPTSGTDAPPSSVSPVRNRRRARPEARPRHQSRTPNPSTRWTTVRQRLLVGQIESTQPPGHRGSRRAGSPAWSDWPDASPTMHTPSTARGDARISAASAADSRDDPGDDPPPGRPPARGQRRVERGHAERRESGGACRTVADGDGLRPERADHRPPRTTDRPRLVGQLESRRVLAVDVEPDHLGGDREVTRVDRVLRARAAARGAPARRSAPSRGPTCRGGTRSSRATGSEAGGGRRSPAGARGGDGRDGGDQGGGGRGASAHVGPGRHGRRKRSGGMGSLGPRRDGGTGRRAGLKIPWASAREGSTPSPGTSDDAALDDEVAPARTGRAPATRCPPCARGRRRSARR